MSFRSQVAPLSVNSIKIEGGTFVCLPPSAFDVFGTYYVICDKHPDKRIPVMFIGLNDDLFAVQQKVVEDLKNCPGCKEAEAWEKTKFPEGAEL